MNRCPKDQRRVVMILMESLEGALLDGLFVTDRLLPKAEVLRGYSGDLRTWPGGVGSGEGLESLLLLWDRKESLALMRRSKKWRKDIA